MSSFTREIRFLPAYDKRKDGYGIHCAEMHLALTGPKGAIQLRVFTGWFLPHVWEEQKDHLDVVGKPRGAYLSCHSPTRLHDYDTKSENCDVIEGGVCYGDGTYTEAEPVFQLLVEQGDEAVWKKLEEYYGEWLEERAS